jgi:aspartyl protease family protein
MRQILYFFIAMMVIAGVAPRMMSADGSTQANVQPQKRVQTATQVPQQQPQQQANYRTITLMADRGGHFQVEGSVDGRRMEFLVDTGATVVALRARDAAKLGIHPSPRDYTARTSTANGVIAVAPVRLPSLEIRGIRVFDVQAVVIPDEALGANLLGMSFLSRVKFQMANGRLTMEQ